MDRLVHPRAFLRTTERHPHVCVLSRSRARRIQDRDHDKGLRVSIRLLVNTSLLVNRTGGAPMRTSLPARLASVTLTVAMVAGAAACGASGVSGDKSAAAGGKIVY